MTYLDRRLGISVVCVALAGCASNPWFGVDTGADESEGTAATDGASGSADTGSTGEGPPTSGDTVGTGSVGGTTEGETGGTSTGVDPQTTGMTTEPATTQGPGTDAGEETFGESSGGEEACGNGVVDDDEECDFATDPNSGCTPQCQLPTCGDGFIHEGVEECDAGVANDDFGECTLACKHAKCGDGFPQLEEVCDDGPNNGKLELNGCALDCSGTYLHVLEIRVTGATFQGLLTKDGLMGVGAADEICKTTFQGPWRALIVDGLTRVASTTAWSGEGQSPDWVLQPYAIYVNVNQDANLKLIGVTGKERLLGKPGFDLVNPIGLIPAPVWTGLNSDWTASGADCVNWTTKSMEEDGTVGESSAKDGKYLRLNEPAACIESRRLYCVQQPG